MERSDLPVTPPVSPMLARLAREVPADEDLVFEPKWDGFRAIVFRGGDDVEIHSRGERSFTRYFPELLPVLVEQLPPRCVLDGEIVVRGERGLDFALLQARIHPAASRVDRLAAETPAEYVAFDLLALGDRDLRPEPFATRRRLLEEVLSDRRPPLRLTPATTDHEVARRWLERFTGAGLDGVVGKDPRQAYQEGKRSMLKIKREHTAECVVGGYREHASGEGAGSLLLGLYDGRGVLHHVGVASGFGAARRREILDAVGPRELPSYEGHPWEGWRDEAAHARQLLPGAPSRWSGRRESTWRPVRPELVVEVRYEHLQGPRFRNPARLVRWRPDRDPPSCTFAQLATPVPDELHEFLA